MRKVVVLLIAFAFALLPGRVYAGGGHGGHAGFGRGGGWGHSGGSWGHGFHGNSFHGHGFAFHGHGFHGHGFVVVGPGCCWGPWWWGAAPWWWAATPWWGAAPSWWGAPVVAYAPYYSPPAYYGAPPSYGPPAGYAPTATVSVAPAQPTPNVVRFDTGRYELRGDGVTTAYRWVWIPNPPTAPPQVAPAGRLPIASAR